MPSLLASPSSVPPPVPVETHPNRAGGLKPLQLRGVPDPNRLAPEDAYNGTSPAQPRAETDGYHSNIRMLSGNVPNANAAVALQRLPAALHAVPRRARGTGGRKKRKGVWKKLLWVKQSYPDNYTDTETFLDHLQRNPRVRPYDFWPLVGDSTVIVQHVCSVVIFICCFVGIVQERVSPVSVVCWGSVGTAMGWILWDSWAWTEQEKSFNQTERIAEGDDGSSFSSSSMASSINPAGAISRLVSQNSDDIHGLGLSIQSSHESQTPGVGNPSDISGTASTGSRHDYPSPTQAHETTKPLYLSSRNRQRLSTVKSALLIYFALLGLSPILKSLTKSTASDSIWAMSCWLLIINIFSFDYGSGESAGATRFPASLSTNAAVMASTVLASRLPSTTHVFSLMLFSMEIFGLLPIFRRQLRQTSRTGHIILTLALVTVAGGAVGLTLRGGWAAAIVGSFLGSLLTAIAMGGCSWWLISLQKYKNVVTGPWDPARPVIRRHWI